MVWPVRNNRQPSFSLASGVIQYRTIKPVILVKVTDISDAQRMVTMLAIIELRCSDMLSSLLFDFSLVLVKPDGLCRQTSALFTYVRMNECIIC